MLCYTLQLHFYLQGDSYCFWNLLNCKKNKIPNPDFKNQPQHKFHQTPKQIMNRYRIQKNYTNMPEEWKYEKRFKIKWYVWMPHLVVLCRWNLQKRIFPVWFKFHSPLGSQFHKGQKLVTAWIFCTNYSKSHSF